MPRQFNYTKRKRITRDLVAIAIKQSVSGELYFDADLSLNEILAGVEPGASIFVEAYRGSTANWKRFGFGTVGSPMPAPDRSLEEFGTPDGILFRVRVTRQTDGKQGVLIAEADAVQPVLPGQLETNVQPLIRHMGRDIGDEIWRLEFPAGEGPLLVINSRVASGVDQFLLDPKMRGLFATSILSQVLARILLVEKDTGDEEDEEDWRQLWLRLAESFTRTEHPQMDQIEEVDKWIATAASKFAASMAFMKPFEGGNAA